MSLHTGARIGVYEVLGLLGAGGMGEVYRARDSRLHRDVALKVLLPEFADDPGRVSRMRGEAQVLAALNHANIASVYGLEDVDGGCAIVLELVEGPTLAERLQSGALSIDEAVDVARRVADALQAAHERSIVHRDLKPANVKIRKDGTVKVLDFGLAKALEGEPAGAGLSIAPTIGTPRTLAGTILGTPAYMSPEQARGGAADKRTDIWAFGCLLFELLTGRQAFSGESAVDVLARVIGSEPDLSQLPPDCPEALRRLLRRCLAKEVSRRLADISDARLDLDDAATSESKRIASTFSSRIASLGLGAAAGILLSSAAVWLLGSRNATGPPRVTRLEITPSMPATLTLAGGTAAAGRSLAISPDGRRVAYVGNDGSQLFLRSLDQLEPVVVAGAQAPRHPFFSPDGAWLGFFDGTSTIKKAAITGGPALTVATIVGLPRGASWGRDNTIAFATSDTASGIWKVPADGGQPEIVTKPNEKAGEDHLWPEFLPDGHTVLFTIWRGRSEDSTISAADLSTGAVTSIVMGGVAAHYAPTGHLVFAMSGALHAAPFDLSKRTVAVAAVPVIYQVTMDRYGSVDFDIAADGTLIYVKQSSAAGARSLVWVNPTGREEPIEAPPHRYQYPRLSPDGTQLALDVRDPGAGGADIWLWNFARHALTRLTFGPALNEHPAWTPDGRRLVFSSGRVGAMNLFWQPADGTGAAERLTQSSTDQRSYSVTPDGAWLSLRQDTTSQDLMKFDFASRRVEPLVTTPFNESNGDISPDGKWLAFQSNQTGRDEIYVRPLPNTEGGRWQVSSSGGVQPKWSPAGRELFFLVPDGSMMSVAVDAGSRWSGGTPRKLFESRYFYGGGQRVNTAGWTYDVSKDGQRFLMIKPIPEVAVPPGIVVVQRWFEQLKAQARGTGKE